MLPHLDVPPPLSSPDYDTVQTVGMTLATILFLLGILIIISKCVPLLESKTLKEGHLRGQAPGTESPCWLSTRPLCPVFLFFLSLSYQARR